MSNPRIEDTPELFGGDVGTGTYGDVKCGICGNKYNEGEDARGVYARDSVSTTEFAGITVCDCCFGKIESEILHRMPHILTWYARFLNKQRKDLKEKEWLLCNVLKKNNEKP